HPGERAPRRVHATQVARQRGAHRRDRRFTKMKELARRRLVHLDGERVKRLEGAAESFLTAARAAPERRDASERLRGQRRRENALAVLGAAEQERTGAMRRARGPRRAHVRWTQAETAESSCGMSCPRGFSTMLRASVNRMRSSTNAMATPNRRLRAGFDGA